MTRCASCRLILGSVAIGLLAPTAFGPWGARANSEAGPHENVERRTLADAEQRLQARSVASPLVASVPAPRRGGEEEKAASDLDELAVRLNLNAAAYAEMRGRGEVTLTDFVLAPAAPGLPPQRVDVELRQFSVFGPRTRFVNGSAAGAAHGDGSPLSLPDVLLFTGHIVGEPDSKVFLGLSPHGTNGYVRRDGRLQIISQGPKTEDGASRDLLIYDLDAVPEDRLHWGEFVCETAAPEEPLPAPGIQFRDRAPGNEPGNEPGSATRNAPQQGVGAPLPCRQVLIAVETDFEFSQLFFGDLEAAAAYVATLLGASSDLFQEQTGVQFELGFVRLWDNALDPWTGGNTRTQLFQFRDHWNANMGHVQRHVAHFLSGRNLGGGIAWLSAICHPTLGYALSANLNGFFPNPLQDHHSLNWDIVVVTHELGHNFASPHTHDYCPPLDQCAGSSNPLSPCNFSQQCSLGTIMSYCHQCPGRMINIALEFHPGNVDTMLAYLDGLSACELSCDGLGSITLVVKEGELPTGGDGTPIDGFGPPFTNSLGQVGFTGFLESNDGFVWFDDGIVWRNSMDSEIDLVGAEATMGVSDTGGFIYSPAADGQDSVYTHQGLLVRGTDPAPGINARWLTINSRPSMTPSGVAHWVAGLSAFPGGGTIGRALYRATNLNDGQSAQPLIKSGDTVGNHLIGVNGVGFGYDISDNGNHHIHQLTWTGVPVSTANFIYVNGSIVARQGAPADFNSSWWLFRSPGINNTGQYIFAGTTLGFASNAEFLAYNSSIKLRNGTVVDDVLIGTTWSVQAASINNFGQVAHLWRSGFNAPLGGTLFITSNPNNFIPTTTALLSIGDQLDLTGDNLVDAVVSDFRASPAIAPGIDLPDRPWLFVEVELQDFVTPGGMLGKEYAAILRVPYAAAPGISLPMPARSADLNKDGVVDARDLLMLLSSWGPCQGHCAGDLAGSGDVGVDSLMIMLQQWSR